MITKSIKTFLAATILSASISIASAQSPAPSVTPDVVYVFVKDDPVMKIGLPSPATFSLSNSETQVDNLTKSSVTIPITPNFRTASTFKLVAVCDSSVSLNYYYGSFSSPKPIGFKGFNQPLTYSDLTSLGQSTARYRFFFKDTSAYSSILDSYTYCVSSRLQGKTLELKKRDGTTISNAKCVLIDFDINIMY